jgi:solute carrier family 35 protein F5
MDPLYVKGLSFVVTTALIWVAASFLVQGIESGGLGPLPLTYIANSMFSLYLPIFALCVRWQACSHGKARGGVASQSG